MSVLAPDLLDPRGTSWPEAATRCCRHGEPRDLVPRPSRIIESEGPEGLTRKFLLPVAGTTQSGGELETESVIIPMRTRGRVRLTHTLCVSSQVGCAMGCDFCETAQMGLIRSLEPWEIVQQWWAATYHLGAEIKNIVFMGMGEPLDNAANVVRAIEVLTHHLGPSVAMKNITISTVGRLDGLAMLRDRVRRHGWKKLNLAVSINAPNDAIRSRIMPINRAMPLGELVGMLEDWPLVAGKGIMAEYVLIPGVNDADEHADELASLLRGVRACVNVIPYNPRRDSPWPAPDEGEVDRFLHRLEANGQFCKRRRTKGRDTMAACGQLGNERIRRRRFVELGTPTDLQDAMR
ncbi:MAG: 23S rRNA (adenine(2503)-C(2))-methyltransferase RlmN [Planctomycetota bacterium]